MNAIYEDHGLRTIKSPFIFHRDVLVAADEALVSAAAFEGGLDHLYHPYACPVNWHENIELLYFREGTADVSIDGQSYLAKPGDLFVVSTGAVHNISSRDGERAIYDCLIPDRAFCRENGLDSAAVNFSVRCDFEGAQEMCDAVAGAFALPEETPFRAAELRARVLLLLSHVFRCGVIDGEPSGRRASEGIKRVLDYISSHYAEELSLDTLATEASLSKYHFGRVFKECTGFTVITYVNRLRMTRAAAMLAAGESVSSTAAVCGFENLSYFTKTFSKFFGMLPSEYGSKRERKRKKGKKTEQPSVLETESVCGCGFSSAGAEKGASDE